MKLAIIGSGACALEASWHFTQLGAYVTLFSREKVGGKLYSLAEEFPHQPMPWSWAELTSELAQELSLNIHLEQRPTYQEYYQLYLNNAVEFLKQRIDFRILDVQRVHKATLNLGEQPQEGSRLKDTFRVIWKQDPAQMVAKMLEENQEFFKLMGSEALASLEVPIESYEDFDLVIDATGPYSTPRPMGPAGAQALNEAHHRPLNKFFYGMDALKEMKNLKDGENVVVVGSGQTALSFISMAKSWIQKNQMVLVTTEDRALVKAIENAPPHLRQDVLPFLISLDEDYQSQCDAYSSLVHQWRELDENVRLKTPMPSEPKRKIEFLERTNIISVDRLVDREGVFLTCEKSQLRGAPKSELKTLLIDKVFVLTGFQRDHQIFELMKEFDYDQKLTKSLAGDHPEVGFFSMGATQHHRNSSFSHQDIKDQLLQIERHIMKYFSRAQEDL